MDFSRASYTSHLWIRYATHSLDVVSIVLSALVAFQMRFPGETLPDHYVTAIWVACATSLFVFPLFKTCVQRPPRSLPYSFFKAFLAWTAIFLLLASLAFGAKVGADYSRIWALTWYFIAVALLLLVRIAIYLVTTLFARLGWQRPTRVAIVGAGALGHSIHQRLIEAPSLGYLVTAYYDDNPQLHAGSWNNVPISPIASRLLGDIEANAFDEVWFALPLRAEPRIKSIMFDLRHQTLPIRFIPDIFSFRLLNHSVTEVSGLPVLTLNSSPITGVNRLIKSAEDYLLASLILIVALPVLVSIGIAIKLSSPGPILFKQRRHGLNGADFTIYKFRTMVVHDESPGTVTQASRDDQRVTKLGNFLRRTSLDELPQFLNVLQGHMSIVGPRPHAVEHNDLYKEQIDYYMQRHRVKPGITGWAQINGWRGETDTVEKMERRVEYDLFYIENWSVWFDLRIIMLTFLRVFFDRAAF